MTPQLEIILLACVVASACAIPGVFLVLRKVALMSDAISHAILLGIVLMFFLIKDLHSPLLIISAALTGLATVYLTELIISSKLIKKDAAIGLIFPVFFSLAVILINRFANDIHLDQDAILLGELAFAPFNRLLIGSMDLGPLSLWIMLAILLLNSLFVFVYYKELKLVTFDPALAATLGFTPALMHYGLMSCVSITAVGAFDAVGSILVVALIIAPPSTAYLLTRRISHMLGLSVLFGCLSAISGYGLAMIIDGSIAGAMATMTGVFFGLALGFSPNHGLLMKYLTYKHNQVDFSAKLLMVQLIEHEGTITEASENTYTNLITHMNWSESFAKHVTSYSIEKGYITREKDRFYLTVLGRETAKLAMQMS